MFPVWLALFFSAVFASYVTATAPEKTHQLTELRSQVEAGSFLAYRKAVQSYLASNPAATGVVAESAIAPFYVSGYIPSTKWASRVDGTNLFVYTKQAPETAMLRSIVSLSQTNILVGTKSNGGKLLSLKGVETGITIPATIPVGSLVMIGR